MKTPHHKAYEYHYHFTAIDGKRMIAKNYLAITPGVDINSVINRWNLTAGNGREYKLIGEVPLSTALYKRGVRGATIANDWKIIPELKFHGIEWEVSEIV